MAKYLVLIYGDEQVWESMTAEERAALDAGHAAFVGEAGVRVRDGGALEPASTATTLHGRAGGPPVPTDGPFLETKEALGGYYLLDAADLDEAIGLVARLPELSTTHCAVEIRPVRGTS